MAYDITSEASKSASSTAAAHRAKKAGAEIKLADQKGKLAFVAVALIIGAYGICANTFGLWPLNTDLRVANPPSESEKAVMQNAVPPQQQQWMQQIEAMPPEKRPAKAGS